MNNDIIRISDAMKTLGIKSIVYMPATNLVRRDTFNIHMLDGAIGNGLTVADALEAARKPRLKAA